MLNQNTLAALLVSFLGATGAEQNNADRDAAARALSYQPSLVARSDDPAVPLVPRHRVTVADRSSAAADQNNVDPAAPASQPTLVARSDDPAVPLVPRHHVASNSAE